jgi:hypothetical protein
VVVASNSTYCRIGVSSLEGDVEEIFMKILQMKRIGGREIC